MTNNETAEAVEHASPLTFEDTLTRLEQAMERAGMTIFARLDHAANARAVGLEMPPATVLVYGNAKGGTPIMLASPMAALDLPLKVLVRQSGEGVVSFVFHPVTKMLGRAGVSADAASRLEPAQQLLVTAVSQ